MCDFNQLLFLHLQGLIFLVQLLSSFFPRIRYGHRINSDSEGLRLLNLAFELVLHLDELILLCFQSFPASLPLLQLLSQSFEVGLQLADLLKFSFCLYLLLFSDLRILLLTYL